MANSVNDMTKLEGLFKEKTSKSVKDLTATKIKATPKFSKLRQRFRKSPKLSKAC